MTKQQRDALRPVMTRLLANTALGAAYVDYQLSHNPRHLLEGFVTAYRSRSPLPDWVLKPFAEAAMLYLTDDMGKLTMDAALGLKRNMGSRSRLREHAQREADARLKVLIEIQLKKGLPLTGDPGAVDVVAKDLGMKPEQSDSLRQRYQRTLKARPSRLRP